MMSFSFSVEQLVQLGRVTTFALSPDGIHAAVAVSRLDTETMSYRSDLWRITLDNSEPPVRLTRGRYKDHSPCYRRDGSLGFLSNRPLAEGSPKDEDDSRMQVWLLPHEGGEPRPVTDEPLGCSAFKFASRGNRLAVIADVYPGIPHEEQRKRVADLRKKGPSVLKYTQMNVRHWDSWLSTEAPHVVVYDEEGGDRKDLTPNADRELRGEMSWDLSPDGRSVAITRARLSVVDRLDDVALWVLNTETGQSYVLGEESQTMFGVPRFSPQGDKLAAMKGVRLVSQHGPIRCWVFDLQSGVATELASEWDAWPMPECWTPDGKHIVVSVDEQALRPAYLLDAVTGARTRLLSPSAGGNHVGLVVSENGQRLVGLKSRIVHPPEVFSAPVGVDQVPDFVSNLSNFDAKAAEAAVTIEDLRVHTVHDVQTTLVSPRGGDTKPLLMWIHGGPIHAWGDTWHWRWNPLVALSQGYAVALPNPSGSTGFGQALVEAIWRNSWGGQCYEDLMATADALASRPDIDPKRMVAMGGSFGGYMTNWIGGQTDRFKCLVTHASIWDMSAFFASTDYPAWGKLELGGISPYRDRAGFDKYSPREFVSNFKTPTLILHGEKDYRVPIGEALAMFEALQEHGVESELVIFPDENHWILRPNNIIAWYNTVLEFIGRQTAVNS
ncbi:MAG: S9 family peptidase [Myxococcales bacterium]|nr:S9 family peptidase [Myxococcales bacterium]